MSFFKPLYFIFLLLLFINNISANYTDLSGNYLCQNDQSNLNLTVKLALNVHDEEKTTYAIEWIEKNRCIDSLNGINGLCL